MSGIEIAQALYCVLGICIIGATAVYFILLSGELEEENIKLKQKIYELKKGGGEDDQIT